MRPGHYEGRYTIRRSDTLDPSAPIVAKLRSGERVTTANLERPAFADTRPPAVVNISPREGETIASGPATVVSGDFEDRGGSGVDPASVRILLSGHNVTGETEVSPQSFSYRGPLLPGHHTVDVTVRGRTAPFADVEVRVDAVPPVVGQFGVARRVLARTIRADANGYFEFTFNSPVPIPGTRYEISMVASKAHVTAEAHLVLYQRQG